MTLEFPRGVLVGGLHVAPAVRLAKNKEPLEGRNVGRVPTQVPAGSRTESLKLQPVAAAVRDRHLESDAKGSRPHSRVRCVTPG